MSGSLVKSASWVAASLMGAALLAGPALADGMPSRGKIASEPESRVCSTSANVGVTSDYVFRGISQTGNNPALQGGADMTCGNFYGGFWGSNIEGVGNSLELDVYGGYKFSTGKINWDVGFIYYAYPGAASSLDQAFLELKLGASADVWKGGTLGGTVYYAPEGQHIINGGLNGNPGAVTTVEASFSQALPRFSIFSPTFSATVGHVSFENNANVPADGKGSLDPNYTYWNAGVTLGFQQRWSLDLRYWDTNGEGLAGQFGGDLADERFVATLKATF
jgi:uncharacterized protein (TIGR02001 family)